jgi:hypothetical protein
MCPASSAADTNGYVVFGAPFENRRPSAASGATPPVIA